MIWYLLSGELDKLFKQWHSLIEISRRYHLCHNPILNLVKASNENIQIARVLMAFMMIMKEKKKCVCVWGREIISRYSFQSLKACETFLIILNFSCLLVADFVPSSEKLITERFVTQLLWWGMFINLLSPTGGIFFVFFFHYPHFLIILSDINAQPKCPREHHCDMMR